MPEESLTIVLRKVERGWYEASIKEYPEVVTAGKDARRARLLVLDALREYLESFKPGDAVPGRRGEKVLA